MDSLSLWVVNALWFSAILSLVGGLTCSRITSILAAAIMSAVLVVTASSWLKRASGRLAAILVTVALVLASLHGSPLHVFKGMVVYLPVIVLLLCVSFIRIPVRLSRLDGVLITFLGRIQARHRLKVVTVLSAALGPVLNLGVIALLGSFLKDHSVPEGGAPSAATRGVAAAMLWAPTFVPMALVMTVFPSIQWSATLYLSVPLAAAALTLGVLPQAHIVTPREIPESTAPQALKVIGLVCLFAGVMAAVHVLGSVSFIESLSIAGLGGSILWFALGKSGAGVPLVSVFRTHTQTVWAAINAEAALFLASGMLAAALKDPYWAHQVTAMTWFVHQATWTAVAAIVLGVPLLALFGIHPVVPFSALATTVSAAQLGVSGPVLSMMWVVAWVLSLVLSPISALNLTAASAFGVSPWRLGLRGNGLFALLLGMTAVVIFRTL